MARNTNRPSNNNRRARNNMSSFIPQARQSIQDNPLRQLNLRNANTRIETNGSDFSWIHQNEVENYQRWQRETQELLASRMFSEQLALGRNLQVDMEALEEATGTQHSDGVDRHYATYQSAGISWRDIPIINPIIINIPPEPGSIGGPYNNESLNESFRRLSDAGEALAQSLEEMAPENSEFRRLAERVRELQSSGGMATAYGRSRRSGIADGQYIRYGTPSRPNTRDRDIHDGDNSELTKQYGERMDNLIIIQNELFLGRILSNQGWGRGYVIVRKSSYLYHMDLEEIANLFQVHGGITCQSIITPMDVETWGKYLHLTDEDLGHLILGFDTSHYNNEGLKTREQVLEETRNLQLQIASYG